MEPKPPGWSRPRAAMFEHASAARNYRHRPPHPRAAIELLVELAAGGAVLDAGCGPGDLARALAPMVERVDAVDVSAAMLETGRRAADGDAPNLRWLEGRIEDVELRSPYALVVAGDSVHWFDWETALPRFAALLAPEGSFALVQRGGRLEPEAQARLDPIFARHGDPDFAPLDPVAELERRGLFERAGVRRFSKTWRPTPEELVGYLHSMSGFVVERLADPAGFDAEVTGVLEALPRDDAGRLDLTARTTVTWGRPVARFDQ